MAVNEQFKNIIREIKFSSELKQTEIAEKLGVKSTYLSDMINGRVPFSDNMKEKIYEVFSYNIDDKSDVAMKKTKESHGKLIPFYDDVSSIGGTGEKIANMQGVSEPTDYIDTGDWFKDATAAIRHYEESMIEYPSGCILALKEVKNRELIVPGRDYVIETSEFRVTKCVQKGKDDKHIVAYSTNTETHPDGQLKHEPFKIPLDDIFRISLVLGYVVKKNGGTMVFNNSGK